MPDLFSELVLQIEAACRSLGHELEWRFLATPKKTFRSDASFVFVTLNPGGSSIDRANPTASSEAGSAYVVEHWAKYRPGEAPLQRQVRAMFEWLGRDPGDSLSAYFIPFRSRSFSALASKRESVQFAVELWRSIFAELALPLIVCMGAETEKGLHSVLGTPSLPMTELRVGWGDVKARISRYSNRVILRLPHLSRFAIFGRSDSAEPLQAIRKEVGRHCAELGLTLRSP